MESKQIRFKVGASTHDESSLTSRVALFQLGEVKLNAAILHSCEDIRVRHSHLFFFHIGEVLPVAEFKRDDDLVGVEHTEFGLRVRGHVREGIVRWTDDDITILVSGLGLWSFNDAVLVNSAAIDLVLDFVRSREVEEEARIVALHRVKVVRSIWSVGTSGVEGGVSDVDVTLFVLSSGTFKVAEALWANTNIAGDVLREAGVFFGVILKKRQVGLFVSAERFPSSFICGVKFSAHVIPLSLLGQLSVILT